MNQSRQGDPVIEGFLVGAAHIVDAPDRETWDYGWAYADYRRSARAAMTGPSGPVTIEASALENWEAAVQRLLREPAIRIRWDEEEFWSIVASLTVAAASRDEPDRARFLETSLQRLRNAGPAFTVQFVANVAWDGGPPLALGDAVVGPAGEDLINTAQRLANGRTTLNEHELATWISDEVSPRTIDGSVPVAVCCWTPGQHQKSVTQWERVLRDIVDLPLLLERNLRAHRVYRRGDVNRPGERGLTLDRGAIERALRDSEASRELASFPLTVTEMLGPYRPVHWYSAEPMPLGELLSQDYLREAVSRTLTDADPIARRLRVAARWYAEAHYTNADDDAALALGVSVDALLTGRQALPGAAMADRYALLGAVPSERKVRRRKYLECFGVRSSIAHGGRSSELDRPEFLRDFFALVSDAAWRLLAMKETFGPTSESAIDDVFDGLRLGTEEWPSA